MHAGGGGGVLWWDVADRQAGRQAGVKSDFFFEKH